MTKYKHIPTDSIVEEKKFNGHRWYLNPKTSESIPTSIVESGGKDWEKIEPEKEKEYTITAFRSLITKQVANLENGVFKWSNDHTGWPVEEMIRHVGSGNEIYSVLRKSDNKEFRVGQKTSQGEVVSFKEHVSNILLVELLEGGAEPYWRNLNNIQPLPERKPLFRSEDGKDIFEEQDYWPVSKKTFKISGPFQVSKNGRLYIDEDNIRFSTLAAAEEYIKWNKAVFTLKDISEAIRKALRGEPPVIPYITVSEQRCGLDNEEEKA